MDGGLSVVDVVGCDDGDVYWLVGVVEVVLAPELALVVVGAFDVDVVEGASVPLLVEPAPTVAAELDEPELDEPSGCWLLAVLMLPLCQSVLPETLP